MKLTDVKIGTRLYLGLGAIILFVGLLGFTAWFQVESMWQETEGLYEHPLMVRRALGELKADIWIMHDWLDDLRPSEARHSA